MAFPPEELAFPATEPFDGESPADLILRSSDGVDFHVIKPSCLSHLRLSETCSSYPLSNQFYPTASDGVPIVELLEPDVLLLSIYLVSPPGLPDLPFAFAVLSRRGKI
ncbi:hypothetical protein EW145_g2426 [Phellinidium pouzarii]|uniref:Uncharacterized protein n=1 Tax=Phellinidium pouzarii TaxID=167371 RepID=A0A4V3XD89_9AGAM|nr:hypothetical protein EW145_g2426 [Phellinidium pouzarii]